MTGRGTPGTPSNVSRRVRRVLIIVQNLSVPLDRRVWLESQALVANGYGVSVICPRGEGDASYEELDGVRIHRYRPPAQAHGFAGFVWEFAYCWLRTALLSLRVLRRDGFDALQLCNPPDTYWLLALLYRLAGKRSVLDHHDLCPEVYDARFPDGSPVVKRVLVALERASLRTVDRVISTNESYRRIAVERAGVPTSKTTVVRSGPNVERLYKEDPRPELKGAADFLCVYLGIMGPQDGVDLVVRAADVMVNEMGRKDCHFALLGFGDCLADLRSLTADLGLEPWVTFTGRADDATIRAYLSTADVGLSPDPKTPFNELSTHNKTLEYMAFGLPVVAVDLMETRVSAGPAAVYVDEDGPQAYAKAICALVDAPSRRQAMGEAGARRIHDELAWSHQAAAYVRVYDDLLGTDRPAPAGGATTTLTA
jgi:glycosyltransferase involved in cell wall biosynthesis